MFRNTVVIFLVSGFWHGANWTFLVWGAINALYFLPYQISHKNRRYIGVVAQGKLLPSLKEFFQIQLTFTLTCVAWIFFRSASVNDAVQIIAKLFHADLFTYPGVIGGQFPLILLVFIIVEWLQREKEHGLDLSSIKIPMLRWPIYYMSAFLVLYYFNYQQSFIYFQF